MASGHVHPAIYAGIAGAAVYAVPTYAHAVEVFGTEIPLSEAGLAFVGGCVSGAVVATGATLVVNHLSEVSRERKEAENMFASAAHAPRVSAPKHAVSQEEVAQPAPKHAAPAGRSNAGYGRHSAAARAVNEWEKTGAIRMQDIPEAPSHAAWVSDADFEVEIDSSDYADVAEAYVKKLNFAERMQARAQGVADVLYNRLNADKMKDMPVIARGQNLTGVSQENIWKEDAWWQGEFVDDLEPVDAFAANTTASIAQTPSAQPMAQASVADQPVAVAETAEEPRWSEAQQDLWAVALEALDDRFAEQIALGPNTNQPMFSDEVGDIDTIDEPEGLEPVTEFMSFKPMAGHPDVQDTSSYIDLLIDQEFSHNSSSSARQSVRGVLRNYLKVIDGGTGQLVRQAAPKHMAAPLTPSAQVAY